MRRRQYGGHYMGMLIIVSAGGCLLCGCANEGSVSAVPPTIEHTTTRPPPGVLEAQQAQQQMRSRTGDGGPSPSPRASAVK